MAERKMTRVTAVSQEKYEDGPFYFGGKYTRGSLNSVIASLINIRDSIPEECRDTAFCEIESVSGYDGDHFPSICVAYERLQTDEEAAAIEAANEADKRRREAKELAEFERLKAKFGG